MKNIIRLIVLFSISTSYALALDNEIWKPTEYIWNLGLALSCDHPPNQIPYIKYHPAHYKDIKAGDIIWIKSRFLPSFCHVTLPTINVPIVMVINDGDESFPSAHIKRINIESLINNKNIIHIFAQNCDYSGSSKKITPIPIGLDFHTLVYKEKWGLPTSPTPPISTSPPPRPRTD